MNAEAVYLAVVLALALWSFWRQTLRPDATALLVMLSLLIPWRPVASGQGGGLVAVATPAQAFHGFGSPALIMVASMFVLSAAMVRTGAAQLLGGRLLAANAVSWKRSSLTTPPRCWCGCRRCWRSAANVATRRRACSCCWRSARCSVASGR